MFQKTGKKLVKKEPERLMKKTTQIPIRNFKARRTFQRRSKSARVVWLENCFIPRNQLQSRRRGSNTVAHKQPK